MRTVTLPVPALMAEAVLKTMLAALALLSGGVLITVTSPPLVLIGAAVAVIPLPAPKVTAPPLVVIPPVKPRTLAALIVTFSGLPAVEVIPTPAFIVIDASAFKFKVAVPVATRLIEFAIVKLPLLGLLAQGAQLAVIVTVLPFVKALLIVVGSIVESLAGLKILPLKAPVPPVWIVTFAGSSSQLPDVPNGAATFTLPIACRLSWLEVST